jgi:hypothetical protein
MRPYVYPSILTSSSGVTITGSVFLTSTSTATTGHLVYLARTSTSGGSLTFHRSTFTNSSGGYTFNNVKPGNYQVVTEAEPFATANSSTVQRNVTSDININVSQTKNDITVQPKSNTNDPYSGSIVGVSLYNTSFSDFPEFDLPWTLWLDGTPNVTITTPGSPTNQASAWASMTFPVRLDNWTDTYTQTEWNNSYQIALNLGFISMSQIVISNPGSGYPLRSPIGMTTKAELSGCNIKYIYPYLGSYTTSNQTNIDAGLASGGLVYSPSGETVTVVEGDPPAPVSKPKVYAISTYSIDGKFLDVITSRNYNEFRLQASQLDLYNGCTETRSDDYTFDQRQDGRSFVFDGSGVFNSTPSGSIAWNHQPKPYRIKYIRPGTPKPLTSSVLRTLSFNPGPGNTKPINPATNAAKTGELSAYKKLIDQIIKSINIPSLLEWGGQNDGNPLYWDIIYGANGARAAYETGAFGPVGSPGAIWQLDQIKGYVGRELVINAALQSAAGQIIPSIMTNELSINNNSNIQKYWNLPNQSLGVLGGFIANTIYQYSQAIQESTSISQLPYNIIKETASLGRQTWGTFSDVPPAWLDGKSYSGTLGNGSTVQFSFNNSGYNRTVTP